MLPSRNTIPQSVIGIDRNEQSDYLTCIQRKNRRSRLEGSKQAKMVSKCIRIASTYMLNSKKISGEIPRTPARTFGPR